MDAGAMDALAEIASMIAGGAKRRLETGQINITVPKISKALDVVHPLNSPILLLPFDAPKGRFILEVAMREGAQSK
jgi:CheY-specific phosphatase CheX